MNGALLRFCRRGEKTQLPSLLFVVCCLLFRCRSWGFHHSWGLTWVDVVRSKRTPMFLVCHHAPPLGTLPLGLLVMIDLSLRATRHPSWSPLVLARSSPEPPVAVCTVDSRMVATWSVRLVGLREHAAAFIRTYAVLVPTTCIMVGSSFLKKELLGRHWKPTINQHLGGHQPHLVTNAAFIRTYALGGPVGAYRRCLHGRQPHGGHVVDQPTTNLRLENNVRSHELLVPASLQLRTYASACWHHGHSRSLTAPKRSPLFHVVERDGFPS